MTTKKAANTLLKQARQERGWTQRHLAFELHVEEQTVRSWERGIRSPSLEIRPRLCEVLGKSSEQLGLQAAEANEIHNEKVQVDVFPSDPVFLTDSSHQEIQHAGNVVLAMPSLPRDGVVLRGDKNRQRMLKRVQMRWITDGLEHSLYQKALILLSLREEPEAVENPWRNVAQESAQRPGNLLPVGSHISQVYDDADGELLILGEPGAGKTTLLLALTRTLLARARRDEQHPIPVVFNLAEWFEKRQPLQDWLVEELHAKYQVPTKLALAWMETEQIVLLLDGLDEIASEYRTACIEEINAYRRNRGLVPVVVCSRSADYLSQPVRLLLNRAIAVQPLTTHQIDEYITHVGPDVAALQLALQHDPALQEMASTPLMLNTLVVVYQGMSNDEILAVGSPQMRRDLLFAKYVERVLLRRGPKHGYTLEQTKHWLAWLAHQLTQHKQTEFYIEHMQPDWLESRMRRSYRNTIIRIIFGLNLLMNAAFFGAFMSDSVPDPSGLSFYLNGKGWGVHILGWMAPGLGGGLRGGGSLEIIAFIVDVIAALIVGRSGLPSITFQFLPRVALSGLRSGLLFGCSIALFTAVLFGITEGVATGIYRALGTGVFEGLLVGLMTGLIAGLSYERGNASKVQEKQQLLQGRSLIDRLVNFAIFGLCSGIGTASAYALFAGGYLIEALVYGLVVSFACGILFGLGNGTELVPDLGLTIKPAESVAWSWANVTHHLASNIKKGLPMAGTILILMVVVLGCAGQVYYGAGYAWRYGLVYGSIIGIATGVAAILTGVLNSGWSSNMIDENQRLQPNEGIQNSLKHAFFAAGLFGTIGAIACGLTSGLSFRLAGVPGWSVLLVGMMLAFGAIFAFRFWTAYGGKAFVEHYILRWYLWRAGSIPWKYVRFLDDAVEHTFMRKIGGGYMFSHRLLLEYFASLSNQAEETQRI